MAAGEQETRVQLHYPWIMGSLGIGAVIVAAAVVVSLVLNWREIWSAVLLEVGATVMLISAVFLVERQFVTEVRRVEAQTKAAADRAEAASETVQKALGECRLELPPAPLHPILAADGRLRWACAHEPPHTFDIA